MRHEIAGSNRVQARGACGTGRGSDVNKQESTNGPWAFSSPSAEDEACLVEQAEGLLRETAQGSHATMGSMAVCYEVMRITARLLAQRRGLPWAAWWRSLQR